MNCSLSFLLFVKTHHMHPKQSGATGTVYRSDTVFAKRVSKEFKKHDPLSREVCILQELGQFPWSPKLLCVGTDYMATTLAGGNSCVHFPNDYASQIDRIVRDMQSVGVRHNDMLKSGSSDIVIDESGLVHLTDFGWGTINGSLAVKCRVGKHEYQAPSSRPMNPTLDRGFANANETLHTQPCQSYRDKQRLQSSKQKPSQTIRRTHHFNFMSLILCR